MGERVSPARETHETAAEVLIKFKPSLLTREEIERLFNRDRKIQCLLVQIQQLRDKPSPPKQAVSTAWKRVVEQFHQFTKVKNAKDLDRRKILRIEAQIQNRVIYLQELNERKHLRRIRGKLGLKYLRTLTDQYDPIRNRKLPSRSGKRKAIVVLPPPPLDSVSTGSETASGPTPN